MTTCACGDRWKIEACDLRSGRVRAILHPLSFTCENLLNRVGNGSLTLATREVKARDIWPHLTSVYITRLNDEDDEPECQYAGLIEKFSAADSGATLVGMKSIDDYLHHRMIRAKKTYTQISQTEIGAALVDLAGPNGIPLVGAAAPSTKLRDRTYESWDRKFIGEAIEDLTDVIDGPDYLLTHERSNTGIWTTTVTFVDVAGGQRNVILKSDREGNGYSLDVDAANHATLVDAIGSGEESAMLIATAEDEDGPYPRFDAAPAWKDVIVPNTLMEHAEGYLEDSKEPIALPSVNIVGPSPAPSELRLGDTVAMDVDFGAVTYKGDARVLGIAWSLSVGEPESRTITTVPLTRASESVLNQVSTDDCEVC